MIFFNGVICGWARALTFKTVPLRSPVLVEVIIFAHSQFHNLGMFWHWQPRLYANGITIQAKKDDIWDDFVASFYVQ